MLYQQVLTTFVVEQVFCKSQQGGEHTTDTQSHHTGTNEEEHTAGVEDQQHAMDHYDTHL